MAGYEECSHFWDAQGTGQSSCTCTVPQAATAVVAAVGGQHGLHAEDKMVMAAVAAAGVVKAVTHAPFDLGGLATVGTVVLTSSRWRWWRYAEDMVVAAVAAAGVVAAATHQSFDLGCLGGLATAGTVVLTLSRWRWWGYAEDMVMAAVAATGVVTAATHPPFD